MQTSRPYRRTEDNILASTSVLMLILAYFGALLIKTFEDFSATDKELTQRVLGFSSTDSIVSMMLAFTVSMLILLAGSAVHSLHSEERMPILLLKETRLAPKLTHAAGQKWMLFISHIWDTGQDQVCSCLVCQPGWGEPAQARFPSYFQAAAIKRQLQRMLPGIAVFLDVDECAASRLERCVTCTVKPHLLCLMAAWRTSAIWSSTLTSQP